MSKLMEELTIADVVVSALPYNSETHHLINDEFLKKMKEKKHFNQCFKRKNS